MSTVEARNLLELAIHCDSSDFDKFIRCKAFIQMLNNPNTQTLGLPGKQGSPCRVAVRSKAK